MDETEHELRDRVEEARKRLSEADMQWRKAVEALSAHLRCPKCFLLRTVCEKRGECV